MGLSKKGMAGSTVDLIPGPVDLCLEKNLKKKQHDKTVNEYS